MKTAAELDEAAWSHIKRGLEAIFGHIHDASLSMILRNLLDSGLLRKTSTSYRVPDPVYKYALLKLL